MMNTRIKIALLVLTTAFLLLLFFFGKEKIGLFIDKIGITKNTFSINIDKNISRDDLYIYWLGETEYSSEQDMNKILIFHRKLQADVPPSYGKNRFLVKYKNVHLNKIGVLKLAAYTKHNYKIDFKLNDDNLVVNWKIKNWYDPDIYQGSDTLKIDN